MEKQDAKRPTMAIKIGKGDVKVKRYSPLIIAFRWFIGHWWRPAKLGYDLRSRTGIDGEIEESWCVINPWLKLVIGGPTVESYQAARFVAHNMNRIEVTNGGVTVKAR
jgi:hypothetical protein